ncbi:hypothetical protein ANN_15487 [Periplaneta americana]|uniref:Transposase Tc1-like domain-containing protein n=1 Tax=Periplaneta americana TaxID=6978 RepID=A0ABQ8SGH8_PERAM|nr:hypothetical protein ANN_15487 [Periplaneta americana]
MDSVKTFNIGSECGRLHESNLQLERPATGPLLIRKHRAARLEFAHQHANWTLEQWSTVLFTDEFRFSMFHRCTGELYSSCTFSHRGSFKGGYIMVRAGSVCRAF